MIKKIAILLPVTVALAGCANLGQKQKQTEQQVQQLQHQTAHLKSRVDNLASISENSGQSQSSIRKLRGKVEDLHHQVQILKDEQRQLYLNLDLRLQALEPGQSHASHESGGHASKQQAQAGEKQAYLDAFNLLSNGKYKKSISAFKQFLRKYPDGAYADNANYWLGEAYYVQHSQKASLARFEKVVNDFPNSSKVPGSLLKIGYIYGDRGNTAKARQYLQKVVEKYPKSNAGSLAKQRLSEMKSTSGG